MDKYGDVERSYKENVDRWVCNLYFCLKRRDSIGKTYMENLIEDSRSEFDRKGNGMDEPPKAVKAAYCKVRKYEVVSLPEKEEAFAARSTSLAQMDELVVENPLTQSSSTRRSRKGQKKGEKLLSQSDFDRYTFHIPHIDLKSNKTVRKKLKYVMHEALSDLGLYNLKNIEFWLSLLVLIMLLWLRSFTHTFGSWLLLKMAGAAVNEFEPKLYFPSLS